MNALLFAHGPGYGCVDDALRHCRVTDAYGVDAPSIIGDGHDEYALVTMRAGITPSIRATKASMSERHFSRTLPSSPISSVASVRISLLVYWLISDLDLRSAARLQIKC